LNNDGLAALAALSITSTVVGFTARTGYIQNDIAGGGHICLRVTADALIGCATVNGPAAAVMVTLKLPLAEDGPEPPIVTPVAGT